MIRRLVLVLWILSAGLVWARSPQSGRDPGPSVATFHVDVFEILRDVSDIAGVDVIDFEVFPEGTELGKVTTRTNVVTFAVSSGSSSAHVAGVGDPRTAFFPNDTPNPTTFSGRRFLTDEPSGPRVGNDYYLRFANPIGSLILDLYDFRTDGGPRVGDTAILKLFADEKYKSLIGQAIYKVDGREIDQTVFRFKVTLDCVSARSARLEFSRPDIGTGIDNVTFQTVSTTARSDTFGRLPQGEGTQPMSPAQPLDPPLNHSLVSACYTVNLRKQAGTGGATVTPLMLAAAAGDSAVVQRVIRSGVDPNAHDSTGWTALMYATVAERPAALETLLASGADPNARSTAGQTAIMAAASAAKPSIFLKPLIGAGANVNAQDAEGFTALMLAGDRDAVDLLLRAGADPNLKSSAGQTAAMLNAGPADGAVDILRLLLKNGADINAQDNVGQTALMLLVSGRFPAGAENGVDIKKLTAAVSLLRKADARTDLRDAFDRTVLERLELEKSSVMTNLSRDARARVEQWYGQLRDALTR